jgi:protein-S-isoprenylcysteine O-methyltransferase Ste14
MSEVFLYFLGVGITLVFALVVVIYINKRFYQLLLDLTKKEERARFWLKYSNVLLLLVPLVFSMTIYPESMFDITSQIKWGIVGIVLSLFVFGLILVTYISKVVEK